MPVLDLDFVIGVKYTEVWLNRFLRVGFDFMQRNFENFNFNTTTTKILAQKM